MKQNIIDVISKCNGEKSIKPFRNIFKNETIYVIASGKSLDYVDNSFFDDKVTVGINQSYKKIVPDFVVRKDALQKYSKDKIDAIQIVSCGGCGGNNKSNKNYIEQNKLENTFYFNHDPNNCSKKEIVIDCNMDNDKLCVSWSTITSGIHFSAYLGAKNIVLCGHDCGMINNEVNFKGYQLNNDYPHWKTKEKYTNWVSCDTIEQQSINLKRELKSKFGINVVSLNPFINFNLEGNVFSK